MAQRITVDWSCFPLFLGGPRGLNPKLLSLFNADAGIKHKRRKKWRWMDAALNGRIMQFIRNKRINPTFLAIHYGQQRLDFVWARESGPARRFSDRRFPDWLLAVSPWDLMLFLPVFVISSGYHDTEIREDSASSVTCIARNNEMQYIFLFNSLSLSLI